MPKSTPVRSVILIVAAAVLAVAAELFLRPSAPFFFSPLIVSGFALAFAYRAYLRDRASEEGRAQEMERSSALQMSIGGVPMSITRWWLMTTQSR